MSEGGAHLSKTPPSTPRLVGMLPRVLGAQFAAFIVLFSGILMMTQLVGFARPPAWTLAIVQGIFAAGISRLAGLQGRWLVAQCALPPLAWMGLIIDLPAWVFLIVFVVLMLVYSNASKERVPLYLTNRTTWVALSQLICQQTRPQQSPSQFIDLGCGLGGTLTYLAKKHPDWEFVGVESAPGPYLISKIRTLNCSNATVRFQSLWNADLSTFDVVYAFLSPAPMPRLLDLGERTMKPGSLLVSNSFWAPDFAFDGELEVNDGRKTHLFFKQIQTQA
ncbi:MAG: class I SAM-dependent methyltransferase [Magnetovibrio sp.]|nr:class I SAM-dependent methyltransferase [Magnetovibrio sp.]